MRLLLTFLAILGLVSSFIVLIVVSGDPDARAILLMAWGLIILWCIVGGILMRLLRRPVRWLVQKLPLSWPKKFVLFAIFLACVEEAITTLMTNLAPAFGSTPERAFITASTNYFEVIFLHSVIMFVPMFIVWAWLLKRYHFKPIQVFLLFGITGWLAEIGASGLQNAGNPGLWIFVYGLMVYLPAYATLPAIRENIITPRLRHKLMAIILPLVTAIPWAAVVSAVRSGLGY